ncbi:leucine--tRNA ligase [bacterium]|nr:MAG: leucine--tRNA ligase [bacterium]
MDNQNYNPKTIESKWQKIWEDTNANEAEDFSDKEKKYILIEFPYPSGDGLHVGHVRSHTALDVYSRKLRMEGKNVLYPIGWDAFGLPTENYAIKNKIHPSVATEKNIKTFTEQIKSLGISFDWSREINTTDPEYYKWTQWIFLKLLEKGLAYKDNIAINWCPSCKIGLANEEVVDGKCERCGAQIEKRQKEQWMLAITKYADRLIDDLETVDYLDKIKTQQINWIGRSYGATVQFSITNYELRIPVFTTRPDTLFGCTYMVVSPEHEIIKNQELRITPPCGVVTLRGEITNCDEVKDYIEKAKKKSEIERSDVTKEKTGVELKGIKAINPVNGEEIPIYVADYVLSGYGTGAIMAVPAHDERDFEFAKKYNIPVRKVVLPEALQTVRRDVRSTAMGVQEEIRVETDLFVDEGVAVNSGFLDGMKTEQAKEKMIKWLEEKKIGGKKTQFKLRDWVFSRQHYWGEPIPVVHCEKCGTVPLPEDQLPLKLPDVKNYEPTDNGESPLANITDWVNTKCPKCGGDAKRETDTMPNWAGSSWYFLRYIDPKNKKSLADLEKMKYWMQVDLYNGGMEHTTLHLLYSRFWNKFLYDIGAVPTTEPYAKRISHGMILAEDGQKMSKSRGNVINPNSVVEKFGADTLRIYEMFMGPYDEAIPWSTDGVVGAKRFLDKIWKLNLKLIIHPKSFDGTSNSQPITHNVEHTTTDEVQKLLHKTIKKVTEDIENFKFNTAISSMMILVNAMEKEKEIDKDDYEKLLIVLAPFAPHMAEELFQKLGNKESIFLQEWTKYNEKIIKDEKIKLPIQVNGKVRDIIEVDVDMSEDEIKEMALKSEKLQKWVRDEEIKKVMYIKNKMVSVIV